MAKQNILPVFIPFAGCKYRCIYCSQHNITGTKSHDLISSVKEQIEYHLDLNTIWDEIAFYGGSFSCLNKELRLSLYELAHKSGIKHIRFSTSPDCINSEIIQEAKQAGVKTIELGIQSLNEEVLIKNGRPYSKNVALQALELIDEFDSGAQIMTGMFGDSMESFSETLTEIIHTKPTYARIYPCVVFKETELENLMTQGIYLPPTLPEHLVFASLAYTLLVSSGVNVIRTGLPSGTAENSIVSKNYHPAMGELVKTLLLMLYIESGETVKICSKKASAVYGYKSFLRKKYGDFPVFDENTLEIDWAAVTKKVRSCFLEDNKWKAERTIFKHAKELVDSTNN